MSSSPVSWALVATALLFFSFAVVSLWRSARSGAGSGPGSDPGSARGSDGQTRGERLGCGFGFVALVVWAFAFSRILGNSADASRLALALVLFLFVVRAIAEPKRTPLMRSAAALFVAVLLGGPIVVKYVQRLDPSPTEEVRAELEERVRELRTRLERAQTDVVRLETDRARLREALGGAGHTSFDALEKDEEALAKLRELFEVSELLAEVQQDVEDLREALPTLEADLERVRLHSGLSSPSLSGPELELIRARAGRPVSTQPEGAPVSVQEFLERKRLRALFEAESRAASDD